MTPDTRKSVTAAGLILGGFGLLAFYMPTIMLAVGKYSTIVAGIIAVIFVLAFFGVFWLRGLRQRGRL